MTFPEPFLSAMKENLGTTEYEKFLHSAEEKGVHGIRFNPLKVPAGQYEKILNDLGITSPEQVPWSGGYGFYDTAENAVSRHPYYFAGLYYLQEPSAMAPAALLPIEEGDYVLDLCAAPGGKSTLLGARLRGTGLLLANDISNSRAKALLKNIEMAGIRNALVSSEEPANIKKAFPGFFDKILIDAPCSGEGMFRREPAMVKNWMEKGPEFYSAIQKELLETAADLLKPGGMILYSTCTFSAKEDEENIRYILEKREDLEGVLLPVFEGFVYGPEGNYAKLYPWKIKGEGHFAALLRKKGELSQNSKPVGFEKENTKFLKKYPAVAEFLALTGENLTGEGFLWEKNNQVYLLMMPHEKLGRLRYLRTGLLLGELKKDRFEPSQALAMALRKAEFKNTVTFPAGDMRNIRYLKGETISAEGADVTGKDGWCLVCCEDDPLGFAKRAKDQLKNKYYPGWRWQ